MNRSPLCTIECKTLEEVWSSTFTDYSSLSVFCCPIYALVNKSRFKPRAKKYIFLGFASRVKRYRLWCLNLKPPKFLISRDMTFNESIILNQRKENGDAYRNRGVNEQVDLECDISGNKKDGTPNQSIKEEEKDPNEDDDAQKEQKYKIAIRKQRKEIRPP